MTGPQTQAFSGGGDGNEDDQAAAIAGQAQLNTTGTDDLLDEIDGLLENNAEEFVRSYIQKGGQ
ncbi:ubiquitin-like protein Pup [Corynebacterium alimapuense]|uniref:Prokaryotic ubiquitin-like protein Pup n=1 Tax=Corynebacterium alimapuense TaxID=1576874 RepID=A0A3M8K7E8_9CORY|nr:ubiquitin-like protein Pup [Corynebacterium alimapuense]RNE49147.1 ubiquitin-like protein Pup [Corynebacterium alimapuense]